MSVGVQPRNCWDQIKFYLKRKISEESYRNWIEATSFLDLLDGTLYVSVPDGATRDWMREEYEPLVREAIQALDLHIHAVVYEPETAAPANGTQQQGGSLPVPTSELRLNPLYTFENFVVGPSNQLAHAAAKAVATRAGRRYNPLFIYSSSGLGKTHLMHAIGHELLRSDDAARVVYTSGERFMNELIRSISLHRMPEFHARYRSADVLLVDDVHIIAGKERTQEEFFHTFNELYEAQKQIVITSDSPPSEIPGLVDRLRSRFEQGLIVDIQPPDLETRLAILDRKAAAEQVKLPEDVRVLIATKTKSSIREMEGALLKLVAYSSVSGSPITLEMARHCLRHLFQASDRRVTLEAIQRATAEEYRITVAQLKQKTNARRVTEPRQVAMYLCKELTHASLPEIGRAFGGKHHTTVLHSIQKVEKRRQKDPDFNRMIQRLIDSLC